MLVSYKGKIIVSIIILLLDGVLINMNDYFFNNLNIFYPMLTISLIPFLFDESQKEYYKLCFIIGIIYDLLYSNIFLYHALLFLMLGKINVKIMKYFKNNLFLYIILVILNIIIYDIIGFLLVSITSYQVVEFSDLIYKIKNSLLLNILSGFIYFFLGKKRYFKHKM